MPTALNMLNLALMAVLCAAALSVHMGGPSLTAVQGFPLP
ncbi:hypothetical protein GCM10011324_08950 [Allosediminivita pacifica]|uniref:Uncharacterized protein n=1 Tax=Allosediminivita pacifica TaxID=1267769 RepID=A0A2T6B3U2_9RHOB|nr:hypothetical protein C8N44_104106 [Allosediminivita pacifica]GGB00879.1 hypothetical protein GCM10011324_08950 [Allosediminivita pacifica]